MNSEAVDLLVRKHPRLKVFRDKLARMEAGTYCIHRSWGVGKIRDYDAKSNRIIVDFETDKQGHEMDPAFCVDKLEILAPDHILVRYREDPGPIDEMVKKQPTDLIAEILKTMPEQQALTSEIEKNLLRLLGEKRWRKFWTATKKLLVKDPRIAVPSKKTEPYVLREVPVKAEDEVLEEFFETRNPRKKISLADKLLALSVRHEDIKDALPDILKTLTSSLAETKQLDEGERLHGIWVRNDLARFIHEDPEQLEPTSSKLISESKDLSHLAEEIPATHYKRYLLLIERVFPEDWQSRSFELLRNSAGKFTSECINFLYEKGLEDELASYLQRWLNEQALKGPLLFWILRNRNSRKYRKLVQPLIGPRLLNATFWAIDNEALQTAGNKRIALADLVSEDPELVSDLVSEANAETAHDLATTLILNQGFEELTKKSLLARFIKLFPSIQSLVAGDAGGNQERLIVSKDSFEERKKEYEELIKKKIPENKEAIAIAREHGDLRENAEYKMARQEQDTLLARKNQLEVDLGRAQVTDFTDAPDDLIGIGSTVELLQGSTGESVHYAILGAWDSAPEKQILSYQTPLAQSLISRKPGEVVKLEIDGHEEAWTVQRIGRWIDEQAAAAR